MRHTPLLLAALLALAGAIPAKAQDAPGDELLTCGYLCGDDGTPLRTDTETPPATELVTKIFIGGFSELCAWSIGGGPGLYEPQVYELTYDPSWVEETEPDLQLILYRFFCGSGAYNERHVYFTWTSDSGVRPVLFALPSYTADYQRGDYDGPLANLSMTGMHARHELVNSAFDETTGTISEWSCWRGLCDASARGQWRLDGDIGEFSLVTYDVDPTYDGEVNLFRLVDFSQAQAVDITSPLPFEPPAFDEEDDEEAGN